MVLMKIFEKINKSERLQTKLITCTILKCKTGLILHRLNCFINNIFMRNDGSF